MKNDKWGSGPVGAGEIEGNLKSHFSVVREEVICVKCVLLKQNGSPPNAVSFSSRWRSGERIEERRQIDGAEGAKVSESCVRRFFPPTTAVRCLSRRFLPAGPGPACTSMHIPCLCL